jgi:carbamoylphosphate synthase large subunit
MADNIGDINVKVSQLMREIAQHIGIEANNLVFDFVNIDDKVKLDLITINPRHQQSFLFHSALGFSKVDALYEMLKYIKNYKEIKSSYTIQWALKGSNDLITSYFRASNILEALDKFTYGKDINSVVIFSVTLNPIS